MALRPGTAIVVPTKPAGQSPTTAAAPAPTPTSDAAPETAPATTSDIRPTTAHTEPKDPPAHAEDPATKTSQSAAPVQHTEPNEPPAHTEDFTTKASQGTAGNANNQWPLPPVNSEAPTTTNALSVLLSAMSSKAQADAAAQTSDGSGSSNNGQQQAGTQTSDLSGDQSESKHPNGAGQEGGSNGNPAQSGDTSGSKGPGGSENEAGNHDGGSPQSAQDNSNGGAHLGNSAHSSDPSDAGDAGSPANGGQATITWNHDGQAFTAVSNNGAVIVQGNGAKSTLAAGVTATFAGQVVEVPLEVDAIVIDGAAVSFTSQAGPENDQGNDDPPTATLTASGQIFTAAVQGSSILLEAAGSTTTMAYGAEGTFAGQAVSMPSSSDNNVIRVNGKSFTLRDNGGQTDSKRILPQIQLAAEITQDGKTFTMILQGASTAILEAPSTTLTVPPGAVVTLDGEVFSVPTTGSILVHDGITMTMTPTTAISTRQSNTGAAMTHAEQSISAFELGSSIVVVADGSPITLADGAQTTIGRETLSAASTGGVIIVNGTSTLVASTRTNVAEEPSSSGEGDAQVTADAGPDSEGAASGNRWLAWTSSLLLLGIWIGVLWL